MIEKLAIGIVRWLARHRKTSGGLAVVIVLWIIGATYQAPPPAAQPKPTSTVVASLVHAAQSTSTPEPTKTPRPSATPIPSSTPRPTMTPRPMTTATLVPPTVTDTATAVPSDTPVDTATAVVQPTNTPDLSKDVAYQLATVELGYLADTQSPLIQQFRTGLQTIAKDCSTTEQTAADWVYYMQHHVKSTSYLVAMQSIETLAAVKPPHAASWCIQWVAAAITVTQQTQK